ncbi:MAG: hypothetical protein ACT4OM_06225 [Actinomycetota bacterium]
MPRVTTPAGEVGGTIPNEAEGAKQMPGPGKLALRIVAGISVLLLAGVGLTLLLIGMGAVSGVLRYVVGGLMGLVIAWFGIGYFRYMGHPPPAETEPVQVDPRLRLGYVCEMCGLELAVVAVSKERAPRHCGEAMVLVRRTD